MAANLEGLGLEVLLAVTRFVCQHLQARKMCLLVLESVTPASTFVTCLCSREQRRRMHACRHACILVDTLVSGSTFITCLCSREHFHRLPKCAPLGSIHIAYLCLCI